MSRIGTLHIDDVPQGAPRDPGPVIRNRRRRPLHPEEIQRRLRERSAILTARQGPTPYGWLVILYSEGGRIVRHTSPDATYADARTLLETERSWAGDGDAWIVAKRTPHQSAVLP